MSHLLGFFCKLLCPLVLGTDATYCRIHTLHIPAINQEACTLACMLVLTNSG